uniref:Uncharacterized protein n=1 Tax=Nicotiana tabacum TaxID=4097 RepID=A0A1S3YB21_TOBAC|nr:PREDICTED: uncharacterized protein LOC107774435 [Nicotiana tabacum]
MAPYEALYDRRCHSLVGWFDPGEVKLIHERPPTSQSKQKRYTDMKDRDVAYMVGEKKYYGDPSYVLDFRTVQLDGGLNYDMEPMGILDRHVRMLRSKNIASVKVNWRGQPF